MSGTPRLSMQLGVLSQPSLPTTPLTTTLLLTNSLNTYSNEEDIAGVTFSYNILESSSFSPECLPLSLPICPTRPVQRGMGTRQKVSEVEQFCLDPETVVASSGQAVEPRKGAKIFCNSALHKFCRALFYTSLNLVRFR